MAHAARTFRVFVSSTFTDLKAERDRLHRDVFPRLRSLCRERGARFHAIDLRWGVSEEAGLDQQTMPICLGEIARCQQTTPRPNFIVLLGDRYGWRPLPETIPAAELETIRERLTVPERETLSEWYRRDDNAIPAAYGLRTRAGVYEDEETWTAVERSLLAILTTAAASQPSGEGDQPKFGLSAVEQEIAAGVLSVTDAQEHVFCFFRRILGVPRDSSAAGFVDLVKTDPRDPTTWTPDHASAARADALKERLRHALPGNCFEYDVEWTDRDGHLGISTAHLDQLAEDVYSVLARVIQAELARVETIDELDQEVGAHARFGAERARSFVGRADIIARINDYLAQPNRQPLVVHGAPGSGKSALLAYTAEQADANLTGRALVVRYIGATPDSSDVRAMLYSLCRQIGRAYGAAENDLPTDYQGLVGEFPRRLALATADRPLDLILDALDQLSDRDNARSLAWLPFQLPEHVSLIVSTLAGESLEVLANALPRSILPPMPVMAVAEGDVLLQTWLSDAQRTLQSSQRHEVLSKFANLGLPLYLRLAFEEARRWTSFMPPAQMTLSHDIPGLIRSLFDRLASGSNHGAVLVGRSLAGLAAARNGLTEDELLDVLSPPWDADVLTDFRARSPRSPAVGQLPVVLWSRLYFDLAPYLIERSADGTSVLAFYHRQFHEVVEQAYLGSPDDRLECHRRLAGYFGSQQLEYILNDRRVSNLRALAELPHQQVHGELWPALFATLTDFKFLQNKAATGMRVRRDTQGTATVTYTGIYDLEADFDLAVKRWPGEAQP